MAQVARNINHEYWRPANPDVARLVNPTPLVAACWRCGMDYSSGARFCHICGSERDPGPTAVPPKPVPAPSAWDLQAIRRRLGLSPVCLTFFLLGITCMVGGALTGVVYRADTMSDWQAVQMWRLEWFLAAAAALLAGILLKQNNKRDA